MLAEVWPQDDNVDLPLEERALQKQLSANITPKAYFIPKIEVSIMLSMLLYIMLINCPNPGACFSKFPKWFLLVQIRAVY